MSTTFFGVLCALSAQRNMLIQSYFKGEMDNSRAGLTNWNYSSPLPPFSYYAGNDIYKHQHSFITVRNIALDRGL